MARGSISKDVASDGTIRWRVRVDVMDAQGKRHQPQRSFPTKREAERGLREWLGEIDARGGAAASSVGRPKQTTQQYLDWWLRDCASSRLKPSSLASYRWMCEHYALPSLGAVPLSKRSAQHRQSLYAELSRQGIAGRTVCLLHSIVHGAMAEAVRLGLLARNPADLARPPRPQHKEAQAWSPEELARFLEVARADSYWPLWLTAAHTGLRRSELLGLRWRDLDLDAQPPALGVRQSVVRAGTTFAIQQGAKRGGKRLVLDSVCALALKEHRTRQLEARLLLGPLWHDNDLVFATHEGKRAHPATIARHFDRLQAEAGVTRLPFHGLRHTHATILMMQNVHPKLVSERLGHADIGITLRTSSHVLPGVEAQVAEIFAAAVAPPERADEGGVV